MEIILHYICVVLAGLCWNTIMINVLMNQLNIN